VHAEVTARKVTTAQQLPREKALQSGESTRLPNSLKAHHLQILGNFPSGTVGKPSLQQSGLLKVVSTMKIG
jgi:hypothetical protein